MLAQPAGLFLDLQPTASTRARREATTTEPAVVRTGATALTAFGPHCSCSHCYGPHLCPPLRPRLRPWLTHLKTCGPLLGRMKAGEGPLQKLLQTPLPPRARGASRHPPPRRIAPPPVTTIQPWAWLPMAAARLDSSRRPTGPGPRPTVGAFGAPPEEAAPRPGRPAPAGQWATLWLRTKPPRLGPARELCNQLLRLHPRLRFRSPSLRRRRSCSLSSGPRRSQSCALLTHALCPKDCHLQIPSQSHCRAAPRYSLHRQTIRGQGPRGKGSFEKGGVGGMTSVLEAREATSTSRPRRVIIAVALGTRRPPPGVAPAFVVRRFGSGLGGVAAATPPAAAAAAAACAPLFRRRRSFAPRRGATNAPQAQRCTRVRRLHAVIDR